MAVSLDFPHATPRPEYPRPQFVRDQWLNLNGPWEFAFDDDDVGESQEWYKRPDAPFDRTIIVPFAYQSSLSGIGSKEVHEVVWYRRAFELPDEGRRCDGYCTLARSITLPRFGSTATTLVPTRAGTHPSPLT